MKRMREVLPLIPFEKTTQTSLFKLVVDYRQTGQVLELSYLLKGPIDQLVWPKPTGPAQFREGLWEQTCFECFCQPEGGSKYKEWNFSPTGDWWSMNFLDYRSRDLASQKEDLKKGVIAKISTNEFRLEVAVPLNKLPAKVGWMAVLHHRDGAISHWALKHSGPKADFHQAKSFAHYLDRPEDE